MLEDYEFNDDDNKPDELQKDGVVMLTGIQLEFLILLNINIILFLYLSSTNCILNTLPIQTFMMELNYLIGQRVSPGAF